MLVSSLIKLFLLMSVFLSLNGCFQNPFSNNGKAFVDTENIKVDDKKTAYVKAQPLDKRLYIARATINGKELNIPIGVDSQSYINQFILSQKLKESDLSSYNAIETESKIKTQMITNKVASSVFTQQVYSKLTVNDSEIQDIYAKFVKNNDWRNGTVSIIKSNKKSDMIDFYNKIESNSKEKSELIKKMSVFIKDGDFYRLPSSLTFLFSKLDKDNRFSRPVMIQGKWVVFYLNKVKSIPPIKLNKVKKALIEKEKQRKLIAKLQEYISPSDINIKVN